MLDGTPICPHCIVEIEYDDMIDDSFDTSTYEVNWRGKCPICGKHFTWREIYRFARIENFEEEMENEENE